MYSETCIVMNIIELKAKLNELGVEPNEYSLEGSVANWNSMGTPLDNSTVVAAECLAT